MNAAPVKILVVDDEQEVLWRISVNLTNEGYVVYHAASKQECFSIIKNNKPDIIILDHQLPDGNGSDICREIKTDPQTNSIFVILYSATPINARHLFSQLNDLADDYFTKLSEPWEIISSIRSFEKIKWVKNKLFEQQQHYLSLFTNHPDAVYSFDLEGNFTSVNDGGTKLTGYSREELLTMSFVPLMAPDQLEKAMDFFEKVLRGETHYYNSAIIHKDGHRIEINITGIPIVVNDKLIGIYGISRDITSSVRLKKIVFAEKKVLELALTGSTLEETLTFLLESIEDISAGMMSSIMLLEEDGQTLRSGPAPSLPRIYINSINGSKIGPMAGSCGTSIYLKEPAFVSDIAFDKRWDNYKDTALEHGLKACFSFPILSSDKQALGAFACYYKQVHLPDKNDIELIERAVNIAGILIERDKAEKQIQKKEEQLEEISTFLPGVLFQFHLKKDGSFDFPYFSPTIKQLYGISPQEIYDNPQLVLREIHPQDLSFFHQSVQHSAQTLQPWLLDYRVMSSYKHSGDIMWVRGHSIPKKQENGSIVWHGMLTDITDIKKAEETLRMLSRAVESAAEGILITDVNLEDNPVIFANEKFYELTGYSRQEAMGRNCRFLQGKDTDPQTIDRIRKAVNERKPFIGEVYNYKKDGTPFWNLLVVAPVLNEEGKATHFVGLINDISERKKTETTLLEQNQQLRKINQELDRFVYSVSHDLRAPLTSVLGLIKLSLESSAEEGIREYLGLMEESVLRLDRTIKDILSYSRNSRTDTTFTRIDLQSLIDEVFKGVQFTDGTSHVSKVIELIQAIPLYSDRSRLAIILNNLVSNAFKYQNHSIANPFIHIQVVVEPLEVSIVVKDNGIGIPEKHIDKIFDMFYRASKQSSGTGLGLYIVKETVVKLGGRIDVISKVNEGTTISITLPNHLQNKTS